MTKAPFSLSRLKCFMQIVTKAHLVFTCFLLAKMSVVGLADSPSQPGRLVRKSNPRNFRKSQIWFKSNRIETKFCRGIQEGREKLFTKDQTSKLNTNPRSIKTRLKNEERTGERKGVPIYVLIPRGFDSSGRNSHKES